MSKRNAEKYAKSTGSAKTLAAGRKVTTRVVKGNGATVAKGKAEAAAKGKVAAGKSRTAGKKMATRAKASSIVLPPDYRPSEDEPFMNERQRIYFRQKLLAWKEEIIRQTKETLAGLHEESTQHADLADRATSETDRALELRARDRQRKLIAKIDAALARIEDGSYGYCEETGEPIGLKRLDARPIATLSVEAQERHERRERVYRED
jgi:DnaK suppressor protein